MINPSVEKRVAALAEGMDRELDADRRFFRRHLHRCYRIRRGYPAEIETARLMSAEDWKFEGRPVFVVVYQVEVGTRMRAFFTAPADIETDIADDKARLIYEWAGNEELTEKVRSAIRKVGGR